MMMGGRHPPRNRDDFNDETNMSKAQNEQPQNATRSTGPKTQEGKEKSRRNALKHGLRAETLAIPGEDPADFAAREQEWLDHYKPRGPGEAYILRTALRCTIQLDRGDLYLSATLASQVRSAPDRWDQEQYNHVERMIELIDTDIKENFDDAVRGLRQTGKGCRWLIEQWTGLLSTLETQGYWERHNYKWSKVLGGDMFNGEALIVNPKYLDESREVRPDPMRSTYYTEVVTEIAEHLKTLGEREERLRVEIEEPDRAEAWKRALLIADSKEAQLFQRYQAAAHSVLLRSISARRRRWRPATSRTRTPRKTRRRTKPTAPKNRLQVIVEKRLASPKRRRNRGHRPPLGRSSGPSKWS